MVKSNVYLNFKGNCEEAFNFYKSVFDVEFEYIGRFKDMPPMEEHPLAPEDAEKIMHVSIRLGDGTSIMGSDVGSKWEEYHQAGTNFHISLQTDSREETEKLFNALSEGGQVMMPLGDTFWGAYFGMFTDKFGIGWMVNYEQQQ
jgi:PhnB protein